MTGISGNTNSKKVAYICPREGGASRYFEDGSREKIEGDARELAKAEGVPYQDFPSHAAGFKKK